MAPPRPFAAWSRGHRAALTLAFAATSLLAGCGGGSENAPFFKNAFAQQAVAQTVPMVHGFTLMLVDDAPARTEASFTIHFKAPEPLDFTLVDGHYQDLYRRPSVEVNGKTVDLDGRLSDTAQEATFTIRVTKEPGKETKSSHQVRLEVFGNGSLDSNRVTPVELEIQGPPGSHWDVSLHQGPERAGGK